MNLPQVELFSDWWANPNPGPGGYGIILSCQWTKKEFLQGFTCTTNNRMELLWVITWLSKLTKKSKVQVYTDSQYTINGIQKWWAQKWQKNNWLRTKTQKAINYDLWGELLKLVEQHEVKFTWVKWHNGHIENERCDELATQAMWEENLLVDTFYMSEYYSEPEQQGNQTSIPEKTKQIIQVLWKWDPNLKVEKENDPCKKCFTPVIKKTPKHTKKTLLKKFYYKYYFTCPNCKTNYMTNEAKDDVKNLKI
jgi:ribonuclease HI